MLKKMSSDAFSTMDAWDAAAFSACSVGLCVLDADFRVVRANDALSELLGCTDSGEARSCCETLLAQVQPSLRERAAAALANGMEHRCEIAHTVGQSKRVLSCITKAIRGTDGRIAGAVASFDCVTQPGERAAREDRFSAFEEVTRQLSLGIERSDLEAKIVRGMAALVDADVYAFYLSHAHCSTLTFWARQALSAQTQERLETVVRQAVEQFAHEGIEYEDVSKTALEPQTRGEPIDTPVESYLNVPVTVDGRMVGLLTVAAARQSAFLLDDLTALTTLSTQASMAIGRMQSCLKSVQSERMAVLGEAAATIAHHAANLTSNLTSGSHMMEVAIEARDWKRVQRFWGVARRSIEAVSRLVMNVLNYSKERDPVFEPTDLRFVIESVAKQYEERAKQFGVDIVLDVPHLPQDLLLDPDQIEHCLANLLINGIEAMPGGGVLSFRGEVVEGGPGEDQEFVLQISDTGSGIPKADLGRIFEPFYSSKGSKGTGIGLAVSRKIVEEHGGRILVESEVGKGTTFRLVLPIPGGD